MYNFNLMPKRMVYLNRKFLASKNNIILYHITQDANAVVISFINSLSTKREENQSNDIILAQTSPGLRSAKASEVSNQTAYTSKVGLGFGRGSRVEGNNCIKKYYNINNNNNILTIIIS